MRLGAQAREPESVWDYPRPPRLEPDSRRIVVRQSESILAATARSIRVLETSHPPVFYLPPDNIATRLLRPSTHRTICEFKGVASYWDLTIPPFTPNVAWSYAEPVAEYADLADYVAFYPARVECFVEDVRVIAQPSDFYGGWVTAEIVGPFKR